LVDGAERWVALEQDVRALDANRRLVLQAALAAEPDATEPCTPAAARFAERSCVATEAAEQLDAPQLKPLAER
jgi:hypothetical protein